MSESIHHSEDEPQLVQQGKADILAMRARALAGLGIDPDEDTCEVIDADGNVTGTYRNVLIRGVDTAHHPIEWTRGEGTIGQ